MKNRHSTLNWGARALNLLLGLALLAPLIGMRPAQHPALRAQPILLQIAAEQPDDAVGVIVQKQGWAGHVEDLVTRLGGVVTKDLYIINAFAAEMPARAVPELAGAAGVRWVSLDAPVVSRGKSQNRYYLKGGGEGDAYWSLEQDVPQTKELGKDQFNAEYAVEIAEDGSQSWRTPVFDVNTTLVDKAELKFYAAMQNFQKHAYGKVCATLNDVGDGGLTEIASGCKEKEWDDKWKRETIKFEGLDDLIEAGHQIELVLTVDGTSESAMWFAFDTKKQESHLKVKLLDELVENDYFYLYNGPGEPAGDTVSQTTLPLSYVEPQTATLYNYDTDRDTAPGLTIQRGGSGPEEMGPAKVQRWRFESFTTSTQFVDEIEFEFFTAVKGFQKDAYGKVWAHLVHRDADGNVVRVIGSQFKEMNWDDQWKKEKVEFKDLNYVVPAGDQLELAVTVDATSRDDMWFAYGTHDQDARVKATFWRVLPNDFLETIGATEAWAQGYQGQGVRVAVVDSGIWADSPDFIEVGGVRRVIHTVNIDGDGKDKNGHGTYMAGIIGSNGRRSGEYYEGVAPKVDLVNVRVSDEWGSAAESDVVAGLQWVLEHKDEYNIRVVNLSMNSTVLQSYHTSPLCAAAEILWFNRVMVVVAGGNNGDEDQGNIYPPANDPFVIAVGAVEDMETVDPADDVVAAFSAYGATPEGFARPDLAAPGTYVVSSLAQGTRFEKDHKDHQPETLKMDGNPQKVNFVASGTSVSAAVVSGASALLLQAVPALNPDQAKWLFVNTATPVEGEPGAGAGIVNVARAIETALGYGSVADIPTVNTGTPASQLLWSGNGPVAWQSVNWSSVNWSSVNWSSVNWSSVNWSSVNWSSVDLEY